MTSFIQFWSSKAALLKLELDKEFHITLYYGCNYLCTQWLKWHHASSLPWRHNGHDGVSNHQHHDCLLNRLFARRSKKTSKLRVTGLCVGNSLVTDEFPAQMASNAENVSIWWRHDVKRPMMCNLRSFADPNKYMSTFPIGSSDLITIHTEAEKIHKFRSASDIFVLNLDFKHHCIL